MFQRITYWLFVRLYYMFITNICWVQFKTNLSSYFTVEFAQKVGLNLAILKNIYLRNKRINKFLLSIKALSHKISIFLSSSSTVSLFAVLFAYICTICKVTAANDKPNSSKQNETKLNSEKSSKKDGNK